MDEEARPLREKVAELSAFQPFNRRPATMLRTSALLLVLISATADAQPKTAPAPKYAEAVKALEAFITREVVDKRLPALSIALVDDQKVVWARGFGFTDKDRKEPATADTVYRVASVSKLFTDLAVMRLVDKEELDLDAPIKKYLPDFKPKNPFDKAITLRMLMTHRSGLVREPPLGSYFHDDETSLAKTIESLKGIPVVYKPGARVKYSNAGIALVGYALERTQKQPFAKYVKDSVLDPLGMKRSAFGPPGDLKKDLAEAVLWNYHGRESPAPTFELGMAPGAGLYSNANDLAQFLTVIFAGGKGVLKPETLKEMLTPQLTRPDDPKDAPRYGIGFKIGELDGMNRAGHGGAIYGFATDVAFLSEEKLGVVVLASRDFSNPVVMRIADQSLRFMLAAKQNKNLPIIKYPEPLETAQAKALAGRYVSDESAFDLVESAGRLFMYPSKVGPRVELRKDGANLVTDDILGVGAKIERVGDKLTFDKQVYRKVAVEKPKPCPGHLRGLIGEYGWDHSTHYIFEKDGRLYANIHWFSYTPLKEISRDEYAFPDDVGYFPGERLVFKRDRNGNATEVTLATVVMKRRHIDGEEGQTFRIKPLKPVAELRKEALMGTPPLTPGAIRQSELIDITTVDAAIKLDLRYATDNNFLSTPLYPPMAKAYLQKPAAEALVKVNAKLKEQGYGLLIHDAYRPWYVTKMFWDATPEKWHHFVADPSKGSRHNRGCAVDLTLYDRETGKPVEMVGGFDEFSDRSYPDYLGGTSLQRWHRDLLRRSMESEGFTVYEAEWWHFDFKNWNRYAVENKSFEELSKKD
jgi:serine beta-lactamase-like protein LACTB